MSKEDVILVKHFPRNITNQNIVRELMCIFRFDYKKWLLWLNSEINVRKFWCPILDRYYRQKAKYNYAGCYT